MSFYLNINRIEQLHTLILQKKTGTPKQLAERLGISRVSLYMMIEELNSLSLTVSYSRKFETFYYKTVKQLTWISEAEITWN
jgi:transcriptional antiterminator